MSSDSIPSTRRTTRSTTRKERERVASIAAELVVDPPVQAKTRIRTRSAGDAQKFATTAPKADSTRNRTTSAPTVITADTRRITRSATATERAAAAKAEVKTTTTATQPRASGSKPKNKDLERARVQSLAQQRGVRYRTPTPPCEARQSEPASLRTPTNVSKSKSSAVSSHPASSPMGPSSQNAADHASFDVMKEVVLLELGKSIEPADEAYAKDMYKDLATDAQIKAAFKKIGYTLSAKKKNGKGVGRWKDIPEVAEQEKDLYEPFTKVAAAIHQHLGNPDANNTRTATNTHSNHFAHRDNSTHRSRPDISIVASGNSFEKPDGDRKVGYSSLASFFEIKREADSYTDEGLVQQTGVYSRRPNRKYVRTLVITERHVRLIHFDRSGAQYSPWINIHEDPYTFVRLVLGLSSTDEAVLGLDTNVQWTVKDGKKVSGTIKMIDSNNERLTFDLLDVYPVFIRAALRGRGTTCWSALSPHVDEDDKRIKVLIKDAWRSDDRVPEYTFLEQARGVNGVSRMLHYQDRCAETRLLRAPHTPSPANFFNRIWLRVVSEQHGQSLKHFKSQKQALGALRDAILSHRNLIKFKQILHRDISIQNILLGLVEEDAFPGLRGILIDLDMAISTGPRDESSISEDHRTGTRMFQSISVLWSYDPTAIHLAHDYLDDLESFFYVAVYLIFGWAAVEQERISAEKPRFLTKWDDDDPDDSRNAKVAFMSEAMNMKLVSPFWAAPCKELLKSFRKFIKGIVDEKAEIRGTEDTEERQDALEKLHGDFEDHYQTLKAMFDKAIKQLDDMVEPQPTQAGPGSFSLRPVPAAPSVPLASAPRVAKRGSGSMEEADEIVSPSKRTRTVAGARSRLANALEAQNETVRV